MLHFSFEAAANLTADLPGKVNAAVGRPIESAVFVPIPRGGWLVLGLLAYHLGFTPRTASEPADPPELAIVVDDCALSGSRFARMLDTIRSERIIFAHLVSPAPLRQAILDAEPRVVACIAARDLAVVEDAAFDETAAARWRERLPGRRYWLGRTEPISFPWGEPDQVMWNARTQRVESDWRRASPRHCIENRQALQVPWDGAAAESFDVPEHVVWKVTAGGDVVLWHETRDRVFSLEGSGAVMWRALVATGSLERALAYVRTRFDGPAEQIAADLRRFADQLVGRGLLSPPVA